MLVVGRCQDIAKNVTGYQFWDYNLHVHCNFTNNHTQMIHVIDFLICIFLISYDIILNLNVFKTILYK